MSYQDKKFLGDLGSTSYHYGQEVLDVLNLSQLLSSNSMNVSQLESNLLDIITECRSHYAAKTELATDADSKVLFLCLILEQILSHGLRSKISFSSNSTNIQQLLEYIREFNIGSKGKLEFWNCVSFLLPTQERERFLSLKSICTDIGRGRAWLRSSLNERSLERYFKCILSEPEVLEQFYESKAWVRDRDKQKVLLKAAADLSSIVFSLDIGSPDLNTTSPAQTQLVLHHWTEPVIDPTAPLPTSGTSPNTGSPRRTKRPMQNIISFDAENRGTAVTKVVAPRRIEMDRTLGNAFLETSANSQFSRPGDDLSKVSGVTISRPGELTVSGVPSANDINNRVSNLSLNSTSPFSRENSASLVSSASHTTQQVLAGTNSAPTGNLRRLNSNDGLMENAVSRASTEVRPNCDMMSESGHQPLSMNHTVPSNLVNNHPSPSNLGNSHTTPSVHNHTAPSNPPHHVPSNTYLAPSILGELSNHSSRSSQESLGEEYTDLMSVSQYSDVTGDEGNSVYSSATSNNEFPGLRILGDTGIGELTPLTSYISHSPQPGLESALDASLYADSITSHGDTDYSQRDDEEDSLSICSTNDGGVSSTQPSQGGGARRSVVARYETTIQELNRENELLKHQLRKYVTAVQLLHKEQLITPSSEAENEARAYETKLVQLAEMHSELLEMNQRLKLDLNAREATVEKLTLEVQTLRGIKPSPVSLWLPCVFLGGPPNDPHHIYQIHIRLGTEEWNVYRRYSDFHSFNKSLQRRYPGTVKRLSPQVKFPPKNLIFNKGNKSALFVEERRQKLELYLRSIVTTLVEYEWGGGGATGVNQKLNKFALVTLVPFLNDFYKSANVARHSPLGSSTSVSVNPIKRLGNIGCLKTTPSPPALAEDAASSSHGNSAAPLQYTGL